jgi:mycofactocin system FadH/OYE family oxidoreductase 2
MSQQFNYLFTPFKIGNVTVKNRICTSAHGSLLADKDHILDERYIEYQRARAKGGAGLLIAGMFDIMFNCRSLIGQMEIFDERVVPMLRKLSDAVHAEGTRIFAQISHNGREADTELTRMPTWAPSPIPDNSWFRAVPKEMDHEDIQAAIAAFARAAEHAKAGGLDGVELHGASGYLIGQFISPSSNKRTDEYGGTFEKRMRFALEVIDAVRERVGDDFVVGVRIPGDELAQGGNGPQEMVKVAKRLEETGAIDFIHTGLPFYEGIFGVGFGMHLPLGMNTPYAAAFKDAIEIPVINTGRINDPILAEKILANGQADLVGMTRALISDPELPNKAREGRLDEIRYCIACDQGCLGQVFKQKPMSCLQNAAVGREKEIGTIERAAQKKKVMIIGGGLAGMETARVARMRGHDVVLYEKEQELGGQVSLAAKVAARAEFGNSARYLIKQMKILGVKVNLGAEATVQTVEQENPDVVVVATGSEPVRPTVPGADQANVVNVRDVLLEKVPFGPNVLVVDGGESHWEVLSTAEFLADKGCKVELISPVLFVGDQLVSTADLVPYYVRSRKKGIVLTPNTVLSRIEGTTVTVSDVYGGGERRIDGIDTVVMATGNSAVNHLYKALKASGRALHSVGDCLAPRKAMDAIYDGYVLGRVL